MKSARKSQKNKTRDESREKPWNKFAMKFEWDAICMCVCVCWKIPREIEKERAWKCSCIKEIKLLGPSSSRGRGLWVNNLTSCLKVPPAWVIYIFMPRMSISPEKGNVHKSGPTQGERERDSEGDRGRKREREREVLGVGRGRLWIRNWN